MDNRAEEVTKTRDFPLTPSISMSSGFLSPSGSGKAGPLRYTNLTPERNKTRYLSARLGALRCVSGYFSVPNEVAVRTLGASYANQKVFLSCTTVLANHPRGKKGTEIPLLKEGCLVSPRKRVQRKGQNGEAMLFIVGAE